MPRFAVIVFPGSNCDHDCHYVLSEVFNQDCDLVWHEETDLNNYDCIVIPGGFSYGDYLRTGAIARFSPVMNYVIEFAESGKPVIGICNGFQILVESGLLPGGFIRNSSLKFVCKWVYVKVVNTSTPFTGMCKKDDILRIPVANGEGNYFIAQSDLEQYINNSQIVLRYCSPEGEITDSDNPNGSTYNIAGMCNEKGNVLGMMPHPERCCEKVLGGEDGKIIFESVLDYIKNL
jgi:phosphoribosylformylglycinamidine synthase subunit PurQ / glutaminase